MSKNSGDVIEVFRSRVRQRDPLLHWCLDKAAIEYPGDVLYITVVRSPDYAFAHSHTQRLEEVASEVCGRSIRVIVRGPDEPPVRADPTAAETSNPARLVAPPPPTPAGGGAAPPSNGVPPAQPNR